MRRRYAICQACGMRVVEWRGTVVRHAVPRPRPVGPIASDIRCPMSGELFIDVTVSG